MVVNTKTWGGRYYRWNGIDENQQISMWEYGMVARKTKGEDDWQVCARISENMWKVSFINEDELKETLVSGWAKNDLLQFLSFVGLGSISEWSALPFYSKMYDMISYFGAIEFLGNYNTMTDEEVEEFTGIKKE